MKIIKTMNHYRRDFEADIQCEGCGNIEHKSDCYDDRYFHDEVMPNKIRCSKCGKTRNELGIKGEYVETRYPEGLQV